MIMCRLLWVGLLFFFKQKTAYEMRISDWSSDVCSSDLKGFGIDHAGCKQRGVFTIAVTGSGNGVETETPCELKIAHRQRADRRLCDTGIGQCARLSGFGCVVERSRRHHQR